MCTGLSQPFCADLGNLTFNPNPSEGERPYLLGGGAIDFSAVPLLGTGPADNTCRGKRLIRRVVPVPTQLDWPCSYHYTKG